MSGQCCKHQVGVNKWFGQALPNIPPVTDADGILRLALLLVSAFLHVNSTLAEWRFELRWRLTAAYLHLNYELNKYEVTTTRKRDEKEKGKDQSDNNE